MARLVRATHDLRGRRGVSAAPPLPSGLAVIIGRPDKPGDDEHWGVLVSVQPRGLSLKLMAASLPAGPGVSRPGPWPAAERRAEERGLDTPGPAGSHLTMEFKGG